MFQYAGMKVVFSEHCLKASADRLFPISKHRSKRIHKKLIKRFGGEYQMVPCIYIMLGVVYAHASYRQAFKDATLDNRYGGLPVF